MALGGLCYLSVGEPAVVSQARQAVGSGLVHRSLADLVVSCESDLFFGQLLHDTFRDIFRDLYYLATAVVGSNARFACNVATVCKFNGWHQREEQQPWLLRNYKRAASASGVLLSTHSPYSY
jgi:hypothetical protein